MQRTSFVYRLQLAALTVFMLIISGCQHLTSGALSSVVKKPGVEVDNITVTGVNLSAVDLMLTLKVSNPNAYKLALAGYSYDVKFNDKPMLKGTTEQGFSVPGNKSSLIKVPLTLGFSDVVALLKEVKADNKLRYSVDADMRLDSPILNAFSIPASKAGEITVPQIPQVAFSDLKIKNLSFSKVDFEIAMNINNPNNFAVDLKDIQYRFNLAGEALANGEIKQGIQLKQKQDTNVRIPVSISLMKLGTGALNAIRNSDFTNYSVDAEMTVDSAYPALKNLRLPIHYKP